MSESSGQSKYGSTISRCVGLANLISVIMKNALDKCRFKVVQSERINLQSLNQENKKGLEKCFFSVKI
jgi:hypothetical protein